MANQHQQTLTTRMEALEGQIGLIASILERMSGGQAAPAAPAPVDFADPAQRDAYIQKKIEEGVKAARRAAVARAEAPKPAPSINPGMVVTMPSQEDLTALSDTLQAAVIAALKGRNLTRLTPGWHVLGSARCSDGSGTFDVGGGLVLTFRRGQISLGVPATDGRVPSSSSSSSGNGQQKATAAPRPAQI